MPCHSNRLQRQGAGAVYLNVFHKEIFEFLSTKNENAEEAKQVKTLSLGIVVPDKYYELVEKDEPMHLFSPYDVSKVYGVPFSQVDITSEYDNMVKNPDIRKTVIRARTLALEIDKLQQESGYPYILNVDTANQANPVEGKIIMSNLCSEVIQSQVLSKVNDNQDYEVLGEDISCNLGSLNMPKLLSTSESFGHSVEVAIRALNTVALNSNIDTVPSVKNGNKSKRALGLGSMGLATLLASNQIVYGSPESLELVDIYFMMVRYHSIRTSMLLAKEHKDTFLGFENSKYATGEVFAPYVEGPADKYQPKYEVNSRIFHSHVIPSPTDWAELAQEVKKYGMFNSYLSAIAPNGSISYINETSASLHPITQLVETRQEKKLGKIYYPAPLLSDETLPYYTSAYDMSMIDVINVYATAQQHIDQGMSLTLFLRSKIPAGLYPWKPEGGPQTTKDLTMLRHYAWRKGIKSIYYVRTYTDDDKEVGASMCESCVV